MPLIAASSSADVSGKQLMIFGHLRSSLARCDFILVFRSDLTSGWNRRPRQQIVIPNDSKKTQKNKNNAIIIAMKYSTAPLTLCDAAKYRRSDHENCSGHK